MKSTQKNKNKQKKWNYPFIGFFILLTIATMYMLYSVSLFNDIENILRIIGSAVLILIWFLLLFFFKKSLKRRKKIKQIILALVILLYSAGLIFIAHNITAVLNKLGNVTTTTTSYSASIVTLKGNKAENIQDIGNAEIGIFKKEDSIDGYQIPQEIIKKQKLKNTIKEYKDYVELIQALYNKEIDYIFLPTNYPVMFSSIEDFSTIETDTKIIYTENKNVKNEIAKKNSSVKEPFTVLLMGVDSEKENIQGASFNGDALMLLTFNPNTLNTTILSIPRDTYVPIACFDGQRKNKITHAAWYGESCMMQTIENFTGISIDYYVKINFKGVVNLVNALGGIEVDVPIHFCEQDSNRDFSNLICLDKGLQTLDGEEALALSRHRKTINDFIRGQNQQLVVKGILNQAKNIDSIDTVYKLLDTIANSMETNMTRNEILSFYDVAKDILIKSKDSTIDELLGMQRLYISGYDAMIYDYSSINNQGTKLTLYDFVPYEGSLKDITTAMKINLGLEKEKVIKTFSFDVDEPYTETVTGKGNYQEDYLALLPNFVGYPKSKATTFGNTYGIKININYVSSSQQEGQIINQSLHPGMDIDFISKSKGLTIDVSDGKGSNSNQGNSGSNSKPEEDDEGLPNFVGFAYNGTTVANFKKNYPNIILKFIMLEEGDEGYTSTKLGKIISQDVKAGTSLEQLKGKTLTLTYIDPTVPKDDNTDDSDDNDEDNSGDNSSDNSDQNIPPELNIPGEDEKDSNE